MSEMTAVRFEDIPLQLPDLDALSRKAEALGATLAGAGTVDECLAVLKEWEEERCAVSTYDSLVGLRFNQDTADADRKRAHDEWNEMQPRWTELEVGMKRALLAHPLRADLEASIGAQAFALWESEVLAFDPAIKEDLARELDLDSKYTELRASASIQFGGEEQNLSTMVKFRQSADREVRHGAEKVFWQWHQDNGAELDRLFDELVKTRASIAKKLGMADFVEVGYRRMCRVDYGRDDVERFRAQVRNEVVPLGVEISRRQAKTLGVDPLMAWDEFVHDLSGNPLPKGDRAWMVERAKEMFDSMGGGLGEFFHHMSDGGFLDLDSRKGKAGGGFCTSFPTHGMPYVFANFNGTKGDVEVLTHEIGHAFQNHMSRHLWPMDFLWPTMESCEIHSMGLEFLTWPHMDAFFGQDGERFRRVHLTEALMFLPYGTAVDHFQHLIYEKPDATPAERHGMWLEMERTYLPWRNWGDVEYAKMGGRWQHQGHIYGAPFYYIDYVLAQTCALQFWAKADEDREAAMQAYVELCARGGSAPFQALVRSAGLTSPFDDGCLTGVVARARETLGL